MSVNTDINILEYKPLVVYIAKKLYKSNPSVFHLGDLDDVIQIGMIGLIKAKEIYDVEKGASFKNYAYVRIRDEILDAALNAAFIQIPKYARKKGQRYIPVGSFENIKYETEDKQYAFDPIDHRQTFESFLKNLHDKEEISNLLNKLAPEKVYILLRRFGLDDEKPATFRQIAKELNVSVTWVFQLYNRIKSLVSSSIAA